jgi:hypothetical protein
VAAGPPATAGAARSDLPRIGLDRLSRRSGPTTVGRRDIFDFAPPPAPPVIATPHPVATPAPAPTPTPVPTPTPPPPINVRYIGSLEAKSGPKVAFFLTEQKEVLSGQIGETVMNRLKIVRIGYESVDVEDLASGQMRRIPLRGGN